MSLLIEIVVAMTLKTDVGGRAAQREAVVYATIVFED